MTLRSKCIIVTVPLLGIVTGIAIGVLRAKPDTFLETTTGRYRVVTARFASGTNHSFIVNTPLRMWLKRHLSPLGIHLAGREWPDPPMWPGRTMHVISVRCEAREAANSDSRLSARNQELLQGMSAVEAECIDDTGRTIRLKNGHFFFGTEKIVWFVWFYSDPEIGVLHQWGLAESEITNFCPRQLRLIRKSDHQELTRLELAH
jgi:hypothetical protein